MILNTQSICLFTYDDTQTHVIIQPDADAMMICLTDIIFRQQSYNYEGVDAKRIFKRA